MRTGGVSARGTASRSGRRGPDAADPAAGAAPGRRARGGAPDPGRDGEPARLFRPAAREPPPGVAALAPRRLPRHRAGPGYASPPGAPGPSPRLVRGRAVGGAAALDPPDPPHGCAPDPRDDPRAAVRRGGREREAREEVRSPRNRRPGERAPSPPRWRAARAPPPRGQRKTTRLHPSHQKITSAVL